MPNISKVAGAATAAIVFLISLQGIMAQGHETPMIGPAGSPASPQMPPVKALLTDPGPIGLATTTAIFAHVAVGGGWTTVFTFLNTGADAVAGNLILTSSDGTPLSVNVGSPSVGVEAGGIGDPTAVLGSTVPISVPAGGTQVLTATPASASDPTKTGWARVESSGGQLGGVGTFQLFDAGGKLSTIAGVLSAGTVTTATIPADNNDSQLRQVGYALANTGTSPIVIKADVVDAGGTVLKTFNVSLGAGAQTARFLWQDDAAYLTFRGSIVFIGQNGAGFAIVALVQNGSLYTAIPVVPAKASQIN
jgi:hypothetical protein